MIAIEASTVKVTPTPEASGLYTVEAFSRDGGMWEYQRMDLSFDQADRLASQVRRACWISEEVWIYTPPVAAWKWED